ncbi:3-isopropylmalate dehydratase small subunit [Limnohabitans sp. Jir61]|uniref:3-isopropylmalate dehydratase small subunit n=1 Tax=Limnohabitans sp. Jir61 TaxID=1826168 RepID=UPI000D37BB25|nr:3-isopropylmalate dehydratase small subunit [Limnohabitans sp. Jir61]PUE28776.1 3-isopropylmalate dehydratase small subunit [Limnohabitans sp. Jir61]
MTPFIEVSGVAIPMPVDDVNTDQIIPSKYLKDLHADLAEGLLAFQRRRPDGTIIKEFVLERAQFKRAPILVVGSNFGCGSSREHAVWAIQAFGIRCVIGHKLAEFFIENCFKNGILPIELDADQHHRLMHEVIRVDGHSAVHVDLRNCQIHGPSDMVTEFEINLQQRRILLEGLDEITMTLQHLTQIEQWESHHQGVRV